MDDARARSRARAVLVDTNVLSELARQRPDPNVLAWAEKTERYALSVITLEELRFGVLATNSKRLRRWLDDLVADATVWPVSAAIAERAATMRASRRATGRPVTQADMLIAATAAIHGSVLATRNERDFEGLAVEMVNPFRPA